ncbi:hypothetical protein NKH77_37760 [Streptomyces sp. M19]
MGQARALAHLDLESLGRRGSKPLDVLTRLVFQLNARKQDLPSCPSRPSASC